MSVVHEWPPGNSDSSTTCTGAQETQVQALTCDMVRRILASAVAPLIIIAAAPGAARAQDVGVCFGLRFGTWTPPLDWAVAGHGAIDPSRVGRTPEGRNWATNDIAPDSTLMLYPSWW